MDDFTYQKQGIIQNGIESQPKTQPPQTALNKKVSQRYPEPLKTRSQTTPDPQTVSSLQTQTHKTHLTNSIRGDNYILAFYQIGSQKCCRGTI